MNLLNSPSWTKAKWEIEKEEFKEEKKILRNKLQIEREKKKYSNSISELISQGGAKYQVYVFFVFVCFTNVLLCFINVVNATDSRYRCNRVRLVEAIRASFSLLTTSEEYHQVFSPSDCLFRANCLPSETPRTFSNKMAASHHLNATSRVRKNNKKFRIE